LNQRGEIVAEGLATVLAPTEKLRLPRAALPQVEIQTHIASRQSSNLAGQ
jgi:phosphate acetyltransferase